LEDALFFFEVVEEVCGVVVWPAADTTGAALHRSTAPHSKTQVLFVIDESSTASTPSAA
jgi:hypothetical protein